MTDHETLDHMPYDSEETSLQVAGIIDLLSEDRARILDVGCGNGRVAAPLLDSVGADRIELVGLDSDASVEESFRSATNGNADFLIERKKAIAAVGRIGADRPV